MSRFKKQVLKDIDRLENAIRQDREREFKHTYGISFDEYSKNDWKPLPEVRVCESYCREDCHAPRCVDRWNTYVCNKILNWSPNKTPHYFTNQRVNRIINKHNIKDFDDIAFLINMANRIDGR